LFLDTLLTRKEDGKLDISVYRKLIGTCNIHHIRYRVNVGRIILERLRGSWEQFLFFYVASDTRINHHMLTCRAQQNLVLYIVSNEIKKL